MDREEENEVSLLGPLVVVRNTLATGFMSPLWGFVRQALDLKG